MSVESVVCCKVEVFANGRSLVERSSTDCGVALCGIKTSKNEEALAHLWLLRKGNIITIIIILLTVVCSLCLQVQRERHPKPNNTTNIQNFRYNFLNI